MPEKQKRQEMPGAFKDMKHCAGNCQECDDDWYARCIKDIKKPTIITKLGYLITDTYYMGWLKIGHYIAWHLHLSRYAYQYGCWHCYWCDRAYPHGGWECTECMIPDSLRNTAKADLDNVVSAIQDKQDKQQVVPE